MKKADLCIATISLARNNEEEKDLRASLEQLAALQVPVYITDGGSSERFLQFLHSIPNFTVLQAKGLWPQARLSCAEAGRTGARFIFYTEPDKEDFFVNHLPRMLEAIIAKENTGVVLASRSAKGLSSFPSFQQMTETMINHCCRELIGKECDYCYGPFLFNAKLIPYLEKPDNDCGWGWRPFLFTMAYRLGFEIENYEGDFNCPADQRVDDATERIYRMKQLTQNINGLVQAATIDLT